MCFSAPLCLSLSVSLHLFVTVSWLLSSLSLSVTFCFVSVSHCLFASSCFSQFLSSLSSSVFLCLSLYLPIIFFSPCLCLSLFFSFFPFFFILKVLAQNGLGQAFLISCRFKGSICKSSGVCLCICEPKFLIWLNNQINYLKRKKSCVVKNLRNLNKTLHEFYYKTPRGFIAVLSKSCTLNVARFF